jgi:hypothetical protein
VRAELDALFVSRVGAVAAARPAADLLTQPFSRRAQVWDAGLVCAGPCRAATGAGVEAAMDIDRFEQCR